MQHGLFHDDTFREERNIELRGAAAGTWLSERSWVPEPPPAHLIADELVLGQFRLGRFWQTPARMHRTPRDSTTPTVLLHLQLEGTTRLSTPDAVLTLGPGATALADSGTPLRSVHEGISSHLHVEFAPAAGVGTSRTRAPLRQIPEQAELRDILVSLLQLTLDSGIHVDSPSFAALQSAIVSLASGLFAADPLSDGQRALSSAEHIHAAALAVIDERVKDPDFGVRALAAELFVSVRYLQKVFADRGSSPSAAIRERRLQLAQLALASSMNGSTHAHKVAHESGFRSVRAMRLALRRAHPARP